MNQEPFPVTEDLLGSVNLQNKQSTHQRQTKKGWNRCPPKGVGTDYPPQRGMDLLGFGWFRTKGYGKVLLRSVGVGYGSSVCIQIRHGSLPSAPPPPPRQGQAIENACESAQNLSFDEAAQATIQEEPKRCFAQDTWLCFWIVLCHVLEESGMDTDGR